MSSGPASAVMPLLAGIVIAALLAGCGGNAAPLNSVPTITTIAPNEAGAGGAAFTLTVNGTNFVTASMVDFAGTAVPTTFVGATQLTATIPPADISSVGTATVTVTNPAPRGGTSNAVNFSIVNPTPTVSSLFPPSVVAGSATGFTLVIFGNNFVSASSVTFAGTAVPATFVSATQLTTAVPAADVASVGTATVTVTNPTPGGGTSNAVNFSITSGTNPVPAVNTLITDCAPVGAQTFILYVAGQNFVGNSLVQWNGGDLPTIFDGFFNGSLYVQAQVPASDLAALGTADVTVFNPAPGGGSSNGETFTVTAGGSGPHSIAVDPTGKFAYVADEGCSETFPGDISMYTIDSTTGGLTSVGVLTAPDFDSHSIAVDPSGKFVYVASDGTSSGFSPGSVSSYTIKATTGALTSTGTIQANSPDPNLGSVAPYSVTVDPTGKFVYVANEGGFTPTSVSMYTINSSDGTLTPIGATGLVSAEGRAIAVTVHPSGKFAYVMDGGDNSDLTPGVNVAMYTVDGATGDLVPIGTIPAGTSPSSIAIDPSGNFAYVTNSGSNDVSMYTINTTTGALTSIGTIAAGTSPSCVAVDPTGKFVYVANSGSNDVSMYTINTTTGALTSAGTIAAGASPSSIAIHPSGNYAYVTNFGANTISIYSINSVSGALTFIGTVGT